MLKRLEEKETPLGLLFVTVRIIVEMIEGKCESGNAVKVISKRFRGDCQCSGYE